MSENPKKQSSVEQEMVQLEASIEACEASVRTLEPALASVLCPPDPETCNEKVDEPVRVPLAQAIHSASERVTCLTLTINSVLKRLEL